MSDNVIGSKIGKLYIIDKIKKNNRSYYYCRCSCGNYTYVRSDRINGKKVTKSCGCLAKKNLFKIKDIKNVRFGKLVAIEATKERYINGSVIWRCICDCGNIAYVSEGSLNNGNIKSCGCLSKEASKKNMKKAVDVYLKKNIIGGTNIKIISRKHTQVNNKTGYTGITWDEGRGKWVSQIKFKGKQYFLGRFNDINEAIQARQEAENRFFKNFLNEIKGK